MVVAEDEENSKKYEQIALCLLGRLYMDSAFNARAMKSVMLNIWKPVKGLVVWL